MDSTAQIFRRIVTTMAVGLLAMSLFGCNSGSNVPVTAPHSAVSRDDALALAQQFAASIGGRVYAIAPSGSMLPTLDEKSIVTVELVALEKLKRGDIIVYRNRDGEAVIHRLYERHGERWFVLGDNNASIDRETVTTGNFLGRVCAIFYTSTDTRISGASVSPTPTAVASAR